LTEIKTKRLIKFVIIGPHWDHIEEKEIETDMASINYNDMIYSGSFKDAWKIDRGFMSGLFGYRECHLLIFNQGEPKPITKPTESKRTAQLINQAERYKGVPEAMKDEFKEKMGWDLPWWSVVIVIAVFIIFGVIMALRAGVIKL
jgi:hypothetical protein